MIVKQIFSFIFLLHKRAKPILPPYLLSLPIHPPIPREGGGGDDWGGSPYCAWYPRNAPTPLIGVFSLLSWFVVQFIE